MFSFICPTALIIYAPIILMHMPQKYLGYKEMLEVCFTILKSIQDQEANWFKPRSHCPGYASGCVQVSYRRFVPDTLRICRKIELFANDIMV